MMTDRAAAGQRLVRHSYNGRNAKGSVVYSGVPAASLRHAVRHSAGCCRAACHPSTGRASVYRASVSTRRSGQSLIEILVTITILIIGVFTVLRLFPIGFKMIHQSASQGQLQQVADDLAQTMRAGQLQAPDGIVERFGPFPSEGTGSFWVVPNSSSQVSASFWGTPLSPSIPTDTLKQQHRDLNALFTQRSVIGERIKISGSNGGTSLLLFGPVYANPSAVDSYVRVYDPRGYVQVPTPAQFTGPHQFAIAPDGTLSISADPEFYASTGEYLTLNYRGYDSSGQPFDIVDKLVAVPASTQPDFIRGYSVVDSNTAFGGLSLGANPGSGSVQVYRAFPSGNGSGGTFQLLDPYTGVIRILPYGLSYTASNGYSQNGTVIAQDATLAVDYTTRDWQILRLDRDVPGDATVHFPVNNLDVLDRFVSTTVRVLVVSLNDPTQSLLISNVVAPGATPPSPSTNTTGAVNVRDGILYLPASWAGTPVRIYYSPYNSWAAQPIIAFHSYTQAPNPGSLQGAPGYRFFELAFDANGSQDKSSGSDNIPKAAFLLFSPADIGKTVSVDYHFYLFGGTRVAEVGQSYRIEGILPDPVTGLPTMGRAAIQYSGPYGGASGSLQSPPGYAIQYPTRPDVNEPELVVDHVQGISFQARGVFLESGDVLRSDDFANSTYPDARALIWNYYPSQNPPKQIGRLGEATEDIYVARS